MNLREAAQQALEAMEVWRDSLFDENALPGWRFSVLGEKAITALRAALEPVTSCHELSKEGDNLSPPLNHFPDAGKMVATIRPEVTVEPVATISKTETVEPVAWATVGFVTWGNRQIEKVDKLTRKAQPEYGFVIPLYTAPPKHKPLTDWEIEVWAQKPISRIALCRAIERAHGIGGEE